MWLVEFMRPTSLNLLHLDEELDQVVGVCVCVCVCVCVSRRRSWLRHCATSRKVADSIPDGFIGFFHWHNPSGRTMGLTQPLTKMSLRNVSLAQRPPAVRRADNLTTFMCWLFWNLEPSNSWNPQGLSRPVMGLLCLYFTCACNRPSRFSVSYDHLSSLQQWISLFRKESGCFTLASLCTELFYPICMLEIIQLQIL
jgi:hypothetical protein